MYGWIAAISIALFVLQHIIRIIYSLGYHLHYYQHYPGPCHQIDGIDFGSGNFYTLPDGTTFVTSGLSMNILSRNFHTHYMRSNISGAVYRVNLRHQPPSILLLKITTSGDSSFRINTFRPHGISVWPDYDTSHHVVYVVNHSPKEADRIEKFQYDPEKGVLHHLKTYTSNKLRAVYDVLAVGEDSFYATNLLFEQKYRLTMLLELFSLMPWSGVILYTDGVYKDVITGLTSATGIVMSQCGTFVYILMCLSSEIRVYKRQEDGSLVPQQYYPLYTHPDGAVLDPITGDLFVGAHPIAHQFLNHLDKPWQHKASSQVLHIRLTSGNITSVTELLFDEGDLISGSSAAVVYDKKLLIGSFIDKLVLCEVNVPI
uniref:Paraoxonase n=1 Tax=Arion vulgaris TaxID=1028688 RepID=A0A0B7AY86_9EUPU